MDYAEKSRRVLKLIAENERAGKGTVVNASGVCLELGIHYNTARTLLDDMVADGKLQRVTTPSLGGCNVIRNYVRK